MTEPVRSLDGVTGEGTDDSAYMIEGGLVGGLAFRRRITGGMATMIRSLTAVTIIHPWSSSAAKFALQRPHRTDDRLTFFGGITSAGDGLLSKPDQPQGLGMVETAALSINVLANSGASEHYFDDALTPRLQ